MVATQSVPGIAEFPREMIAAAEADADRDADRVIEFLNAIGLGATPENPQPLPANFVLRLATGLRLLAWEALGYSLHRDAGLPAAQDVIRDAFCSLLKPAASARDLDVAVMRLSLERFAWSGRSLLDAEIMLDLFNDEAALDALAEYLWATRHNGPVAAGPQRGDDNAQTS
jgi:hypothetical protein